MTNNKQQITLPTKSAKEIELRVLGTLMNIGDPNHLEIMEAIGALSVDLFYSPNTKVLFETIKDQYRQGLYFDFITLNAIAPGDLYHLIDYISKDAYFSLNLLKDDIKQLEQFHLIRKKAKIIESLTQTFMTINDPAHLQAVIEKSIEGLTSFKTQDKSYIDSLEQIIDRILTNQHIKTHVVTQLRYWPPFPNSSLITIAGRSGVGKSFIGLYLLHHILEVSPDTQAIYFNLEMMPETIVERYAGMFEGYERNQIETVKKGASFLMRQNVSVVTKPLISIDEIEGISRAQCARMPVSVILVDYVGLVRCGGGGDKKYQEQEEIAKRLSALAIELGCIVLCLLQVNREYKNRPIGQRCPTLTDAADSSGCERSSTWWLGLDQPQIDSDDAQFKDLFIVRNRKSRGKEGYFSTYFKFKDGQFHALEHNPLPQDSGIKRNSFATVYASVKNIPHKDT